MNIARISLLALVALTGCVGSTSTEGTVSALECGDGQVCPDGRLCPADGQCDVPEEGACECVDAADPELCAGLLVRCEERDADGDQDDGAEPGQADGVCEALARWCEEGDWAACDVRARHCADGGDPGDCPCACDANGEDGAANEDCRCDCEPQPGDACDELVGLCERGEQEACERLERECRADGDPGDCWCDCPDDAQNADCPCDCDPAPVDRCRELMDRCDQGEPEACEWLERECRDPAEPEPCPCDCAEDNPDGADCQCNCEPGQADRCAELWAGCERGEDDACWAWEMECADGAQP